METTTNYGLKKPGQDEFYDVGDFNDNMDKIDAELKKCSEAAGNPMEAVTEFTPATDRENIKSGEKLGTALGKIAKFLADLKAAAFKSVANNLTTTEEGSVLDARQGTVLQAEIDQVNSDLTELSTYKVINLSTALSVGSSVTLSELIDAREVVAYANIMQFTVKQCEKGITARSATYNTWDGNNSTYYQVYHVTVDFSTGKVSLAGSHGVSAGEITITKIYYK